MGTYSPGSRGMALSYGRMGPTTLDSLLTTLNQGRALCSTLTGTYSPGSGRTRPNQAKGPTCLARVETTREASHQGFLKDRASSIFTIPTMTGNTLKVSMKEDSGRLDLIILHQETVMRDHF